MKFRLVLIAILAVILVSGNLIIDRWPTELYKGDSNGYYLHVVSFFVNQDVGNYDQTIGSLKEEYPAYEDPREDKFGIRLTPIGRYYVKYTVGVSLLESPFFLLAHAYASVSDQYKATGWSKPYLLIVGFAPVVYVLIGLYLLIGILRRYYDKATVAITILALALATNLFYHTNYVVMSHAFLFFLHAALIHLSVSFYEQSSYSLALLVGLVVGLISITRVPEIIAALVPLLWGVKTWATLKERFLFFFVDNKRYLATAAFGFLMIFSIQLFYWNYVSGQLVFNPYQGETFNFFNPKIYKGFFDFQNGWLIYTPIMAFSLYGLFRLKNGSQAVFWPAVVFISLHAYIHYCYYAWTFFPGLGQRPMVETYPLLSFGLAAAFSLFFKRRSLRWLPFTSLIVFGALNLFQTWQMKKGVIWPERHNAAFYWETFGSLTPTLNSLRAYDTHQLQPEEGQIELKAVIHQDGFENRTQYADSQLSEKYAYEGAYSYYALTEEQTIINELSIPRTLEADWLKLSISAFIAPSEQIWDRDLCMRMFAELSNLNGKNPRKRNIAISPHIGNSTFSIWSTGSANEWGEASYFVKLPKSGEYALRVFLRNEHGQKLYLDNFEVALYGKP
ncbi:MAG: hypothetical protein AAFN81_27350 [Bacteroidota bacterium]